MLKRKDILITIAVAALIFFAWLSRMFTTPFGGGCNVYRPIIYLALFICWGFSLHHRIIHPQVRRFAVSIAALMVLWFILRTVRFSIGDSFTVLSRYLWYMYYLPMLFLPLLALFTALTIGLPETQRLPKKYNLFWLPAAVLFLFVITNDLHQLVFVFHNSLNWNDNDYGYSFLYYIIVSYLAVCYIAMLVILAVKSKYPKNRKWVSLPCIPFFLLICYWGLYVTHTKWALHLFGDMTAVSCVLSALSFELCIRCGLIRSNTGYGELLRAGSLGTQIADRENNVRLCGADTVTLTKEQIIGAKLRPVLINNGTLLKSKPIRYGSVLWQEDVSYLTEAIEDFEENCRELSEQNRIRMENLEAEKNIISLQEKKRACDILHKETAKQLDIIDSLLAQYDFEADENARAKILASVAVVGAYIKRYGNLLLVCERNAEADIADLTRCFEESFINLELSGTSCLCSLPADIKLETKDMLRIYSSFEDILENCLFDISSVWVNGREKNDEFLLNIELVSNSDLTRCACKADLFTSDLNTCRFTFKLQKGGAKK